MSFKTKLDFGNDNRQAKQFQFSEIILSGKTTFGVTNNLIPENFTGDTINIEARQYIKTGGLMVVDGTQQEGFVMTSDANGKTSWQSLIVNNNNNYLSGSTFNTSSGTLSLNMVSGETITVNLDGRYLTSETDSQTLSFSANTGDLAISNGNTVNLDGRYQLSGTTPDLTGYIPYTGATKNVDLGVNGLITSSVSIGNWLSESSIDNLYLYNSNVTNKHVIYGVEPNGTKHYNSFVGYGTDAPGQKLHIADGNILLEGGGETANIYKRGVTFTNTHVNSPFINPVFQIGRIIEGGDGAPQFRWMYNDDVVGETVVMELDSEGIMSSVRQERGSHFEGHIEGEANPFFRINSYPDIRLEFGPGGLLGTDVSMSRPLANQIAFNRGTGGSEVESVRIDENGNVGINIIDPLYRLHVFGTAYAQDALQTSGIKIGYDTIEQWSADVDGASVAINYNGFNGGTTRFRNLGVFDGKNGVIWDVVGSTRNTQFYGPVGMEETLLVTGNVSGGTFHSSASYNDLLSGDTTALVTIDYGDTAYFTKRSLVSTATTAYTIIPANRSQLVRFTSNSVINVTVNTDSLTNIGDIAEIDQWGTNDLNIVAGTAILRKNIKRLLITDGIYSRVAIQKMSETEYRVYGELELG